jgi:hypothetical protein
MKEQKIKLVDTMHKIIGQSSPAPSRRIRVSHRYAKLTHQCYFISFFLWRFERLAAQPMG